MAKYTIVGNETDGFCIKIKKYWFLPATLLICPKQPNVIWKAKSFRGAQGYINLLQRKDKSCRLDKKQ